MLKTKIKKNRNYSFLNIFLGLVLLSISINANFTRDNTKQIVIDTISHLQWQDNEDTKTITKKWIDAINYCKNLTFGGYSDWRLPNINELKSIVDRTKVNHTIVESFKNIYSSAYWSSTTYNGYSDYHNDKTVAWQVNFEDGEINLLGKEGYDRVLCVRGGQK